MTIQPLDSPEDPGQLVEVIDQLLCTDMLMFSTDYPHAHFDDPVQSMPQGLPDELRSKIMAGNALATYRFE